MSEQAWIVFTDGACSGNPGPGGWAFVALRHQPGEPFVWEEAGGEPATTNNRMEMSAVATFLERVLEGPEAHDGTIRVELLTDSTYVIQGVTSWVHGWKKRGWKKSDGTAVVNQDLWETLDDLASHPRLKLKFRYVRGHSEIPGNERADVLSVALSKGLESAPFVGPLAQYSGEAFRGFAGDAQAWLHSNQDWFEDVKGPGERSKSSSASPSKSKGKGPALGYLSYLNGQLIEHRDWKSCEARVKGKSGARFRKFTSAAEKAEILKDWKV
jgi:ribonuclease HI